MTVVIVTYSRKKQLDALTTDEMFEGQRFAILAMFYFNIKKIHKLIPLSVINRPGVAGAVRQKASSLTD